MIPFIYLFPMIWDISGIFMAQPVSDALALLVCIFFVARERRLLYRKLPEGCRDIKGV